MKRNLAIAVLVLLFIIGWPNQTGASWALLSTEELIRQSDTILIGEIIGSADESQRPNGTWTTYWKVKVYYYLKGDQVAQEVIVATLGAEKKSFMTANDYRLDQWGKTVLLMLDQREVGLEPFSPQGVITLQKNGATPNIEQQIDGKRVLKEFTVINPQSNDLKVLEEYISGNSSIVGPNSGRRIPTMEFQMARVFWQTVNFLILIGIFVLIVFVPLWTFKRVSKIERQLEQINRKLENLEFNQKDNFRGKQ